MGGRQYKTTNKKTRATNAPIETESIIPWRVVNDDDAFFLLSAFTEFCQPNIEIQSATAASRMKRISRAASPFLRMQTALRSRLFGIAGLPARSGSHSRPRYWIFRLAFAEVAPG